ncbi:zinc finger CCHC domain-containing protein 8 homolog [Galleria mellonella]|uniref:Zinc finger CCHC domain-containing protein 8 homolog n=1 Tax=Galleria mellonella TaxID=7137 RepID=A0A6J1WXI9_GALME|nr:zinc finger CCHC domain-containing protein 8 homolog [Galleria mellonella]
MSKRKAGVNNIIYELDNEDVEISSDEEVIESKISRIDTKICENHLENILINNQRNADVINIDCSNKDIDNSELTLNSQNGGKSSPVIIIEEKNNGLGTKNVESELDNKKLTAEGSKTTIFNEDIVIDSPASNSDLGVVGCENRTPLVTIRFRDNRMAKNYKSQLKAFMLNLIKLHDEENFEGSETESDLELDIWPEDLIDEEFEKRNEPQDNLFFIDTAPCEDVHSEVPKYKQVSSLISNAPDQKPSPPPVVRRGPICFNCDGGHPLRDCPVPKNRARIAENRKNMGSVRVGRYHVEDEQKYGHLIAGRISGQLRHALGLKRHELPLHIYRMRMLGYPPGWLEEARISHSGITMFDSTGTAIMDPDEEEGELCEPGSKDKFDIKKILDFPGFNVPTTSRYKEEAHLYGLPPMSERDSKLAMLQMLAPNAMKAYKRKKLTFFPSASMNNSTQEGQAEMDLDSGDETADFPSVPPLPDEAPPSVPLPPPPPPPLPPSPPPPPPDDEIVNQNDNRDEKTECPANDSAQSIEIVDDNETNDIPTPQCDECNETPHTLSLSQSSEDVITIDLDGSYESGNDSAKDINVDDKTKDKVEVPEIEVLESSFEIVDDDEKQSSGRGSPSLDDLEKKKLLLLQALDSSQESADIVVLNDSVDEEEIKTPDDNVIISMTDIEEKSDSNTDKTVINSPTNFENGKRKHCNSTESEPEVSKTPESRTGHVKTTSYGTPVVNIASPYIKLPSDDKFAKDICDVINFENLPNSTGKYKKISNLLKKVKSKVDKIQES